MTINGGKPHAVGDKGQRYEVTYLDKDGKTKPFGWTDYKVTAKAMAKSIVLHPSMHKPEVFDRCTRQYLHIEIDN